MPSSDSLAPRADLFWIKILWSQHGCWEWGASRHRNGYGQFSLPGGKHITAHRAAWTLLYGPIPAGMVVMHRCDNRGCVRPDHLRLGTQSENIQEMYDKGRAPARTGPLPKEKCARGHNDWYVGPTGRRTCRPCRRASVRAWSKRRRADARGI